MPDNKYGKLYTVGDVKKILQKYESLVSEVEGGENDSYVDGNMIKAIDVYKGKLSNDEPVMVLLAHDRRALAAVNAYRSNQSADAPQDHLDLIEKTVADFENWRSDHPDTMHEPD